MGCTLLLVISLRPSALAKPLDLECFREARKIPCDDDTREKRAAGRRGICVCVPAGGSVRGRCVNICSAESDKKYGYDRMHITCSHFSI